MQLSTSPVSVLVNLTLSALDTLALRIADGVAKLTAWAISTRRELASECLDDEDCEEQGLPYGSRVTDAVFVRREPSVSRWRVDAWIDEDTVAPEGAVRFDLLGYSASIYYLRKGRSYEGAHD